MNNQCALFSQIPFLLGLYTKFQLFDIVLVPNYRFTRRPTMTHIILKHTRSLSNPHPPRPPIFSHSFFHLLTYYVIYLITSFHDLDCLPHWNVSFTRAGIFCCFAHWVFLGTCSSAWYTEDFMNIGWMKKCMHAAVAVGSSWLFLLPEVHPIANLTLVSRSTFQCVHMWGADNIKYGTEDIEL